MIIFFGPPGSGKSEQGRIIAKKYGWRWLSTGQLLRDQQDKKIVEDLATGNLYSEEFVTKLVEDAVVKAEAEGVEVILDGYPRTDSQARWLIDNAEKVGCLDGVVVLEVPVEETVKRLKARGRDVDGDDNYIRTRKEIFEQNIYSILSLLEDKNVKITTVDGVGSIDEVTVRIEDVMREWGVLDNVRVVEVDDSEGREKSYGE